MFHSVREFLLSVNYIFRLGLDKLNVTVSKHSAKRRVIKNVSVNKERNLLKQGWRAAFLEMVLILGITEYLFSFE